MIALNNPENRFHSKSVSETNFETMKSRFLKLVFTFQIIYYVHGKQNLDQNINVNNDTILNVLARDFEPFTRRIGADGSRSGIEIIFVKTIAEKLNQNIQFFNNSKYCDKM